jgi:hypothetical protein
METSATERVRVVGPGQTYVGKQGFTYGAGASSETVGAEHVCMNVLPMPDGRRANAHYHRGVETISYLLGRELRRLLWRERIGAVQIATGGMNDDPRARCSALVRLRMGHILPGCRFARRGEHRHDILKTVSRCASGRRSMALNTADAEIFISISRSPSVVNASASTTPPPSRIRCDRISLSQIERRIANSQRSTRVPGTN